MKKNQSVSKNQTGRGGARSNAGRPKGVPNKLTSDVKEMILAALDKAGGADYLYTQSINNPTAFMTLVGKVLPMQVNAAHSGGFEIKIIRHIVDPSND